MRSIIILLSLLLLAQTISATTIHVPADRPTIQAGIDAAVDGDTVLVADGIYAGDGNRDNDFGGRRIVLQSKGGPEFALIDCEANQSETP